MCRVRRVKGGRIAKVGPRRAPVDAAPLVPVRAIAGERVCVDAGASVSSSGVKRSERIDMPREAMEVGNLAGASCMSLLRVWAHNARDTYERMWRHHVGESPKAFTFDVRAVEGDGTALVRERKLHFFAEANVRNEEKIWRKVHGSSAAIALWRKANRGGGETLRKRKMRNDAVVAEIRRRERDGSFFSEEQVAPVQAVVSAAGAAIATTVVRSVDAGGAGTSAGARDIMPASYADDVRCIHRALNAEEAGLRKPNANDRLIVARSAAFARGDMAQAARCDAQATRRQDAKRAARLRRKARRDIARVEVAEMQRDLRSDSEQ